MRQEYLALHAVGGPPQGLGAGHIRKMAHVALYQPAQIYRVRAVVQHVLVVIGFQYRDVRYPQRILHRRGQHPRVRGYQHPLPAGLRHVCIGLHRIMGCGERGESYAGNGEGHHGLCLRVQDFAHIRGAEGCPVAHNRYIQSP
ncbi:hypothetical protein SDC9_176235 [bioreactor metagenome]|uniref:Uncharacterized protein n=1 Tax=bioreactor metagenome TaxID=1076179 RepID=A0A645GRB8_9ZZZZ